MRHLNRKAHHVTIGIMLLFLFAAGPAAADVYTYDFTGGTPSYVYGDDYGYITAGGVATFSFSDPNGNGAALLKIQSSNIMFGSLFDTSFNITSLTGSFYASYYVDRPGVTNTDKPYDALINVAVTDMGSGQWVTNLSSTVSSVHDYASGTFTPILPLWGIGMSTLESNPDWAGATIIWAGVQAGVGAGTATLGTDKLTIEAPEPSSFLLLGLGLLGLAVFGRRLTRHCNL